MQVYQFKADETTSQVEAYTPKPIQKEATLQRWLQQNPEVLLEESILVIGREVHSGSGPIDLLALDRFGNTIIFELKIGDTKSKSTSEDKIIGQPQRYAAALENWDFQRLSEVFQNYQQEIANGKWTADDPLVSDTNISESLDLTFGSNPDQFNHYQRMVIVAENITWNTAQTARYLQRGPGRHSNIQCVQVQQFTPPDGNSQPLLTSTPMVDYDLGRVRPPNYTNPNYNEINERIADRAFQSIASIVCAEKPSEVFISGFGEREPSLHSNASDHPQSVYYTLRVKPDTDPGHVGITIDMDSDESALASLRNNAQAFENEGYTFNGDHTRYRIVEQQWKPVSDPRALEHDGLLDEIAERYATLVRIGHDVLAGTS